MSLYGFLTREPSDVDLVVVTDGRWNYLTQCVQSLVDSEFWSFHKVIVVDDSGDPFHAKRVDDLFDGADILHHHPRKGMAQSVRSGWERIESDFAFHLEEDFVLLRPLPPADEVLEVVGDHERLANMGFKRLPWWGREVDLGDQLAAILEQSTRSTRHEKWYEHNHIYSLNPHVVPRRTFRWGWPDGNEAGQTERMLWHEDPYCFGMWGHPEDRAFFEHVGHQRSAGWRL